MCADTATDTAATPVTGQESSSPPVSKEWEHPQAKFLEYLRSLYQYVPERRRNRE